MHKANKEIYDVECTPYGFLSKKDKELAFKRGVFSELPLQEK